MLKQNYGIDFYTYTGYQSTGLCIEVSDDCKTMCGIAYISHENYQITLPKTFAEACDNVNLLATYTSSVRSGAQVQKLSNITLTFTRDVEVLAEPNAISELIKMGVSGLECWHSLLRYPDNTQELEALKIAKKYNLFVSGGSDHDGLCGGQYERYEDLSQCRFYHTECSLGTTEEFFREIKNGKKAADRNDILDHYIKLQEEIIKNGSVI